MSSKGWHFEPQKHKMASKGIKSTFDFTNLEDLPKPIPDKIATKEDFESLPKYADFKFIKKPSENHIHAKYIIDGETKYSFVIQPQNNYAEVITQDGVAGRIVPSQSHKGKYRIIPYTGGRSPP